MMSTLLDKKESSSIIVIPVLADELAILQGNPQVHHGEDVLTDQVGINHQERSYETRQAIAWLPFPPGFSAFGCSLPERM